ncbi:MAG: S41 family peptidase [Clostridium sp.]|uniref:S41 family peptidase n=1 Tax=Clostridium sp. TaxID=1506 RepID=UPI003EE668A1
MKNKWGKRVIIGLSGVLIAVGCFSLGNIAATKGLVLTNISSKVKNAMQEMNNTEKYSELFDVRSALIANFDGEVDDTKLLEGAIKGMTNALDDPYTIYMTKEEYKSYNEQNSGEYVGIGVYIGVEDGKVEIINPMEGSPAKNAGLRAGDKIISVNGEKIGSDTEKAGSLIKGKEGEEVALEIQRKGEKTLKTFKIKRAPIETEDVTGEMINKDIGYVSITGFNLGVTEDLKKQIQELKGKGMKGLILDLRGNPGGYLHEAVGIASQFIENDKTITYTINKYDKEVVEKSKGGDAIGMPLVVLIDGGSASASEVVTGALRDYKAATIVGMNSFGKGIVQAPVEFKDGSALKVTISKYYTPNGENIHKTGIAPDVIVEIPEEVLNKPYNREADSQLKKAIEVMNQKINS